MPAVALQPLLDEEHDVKATVAISANTIKMRVFIFWYLKLKKTCYRVASCNKLVEFKGKRREELVLVL
jgi:hypothetical protein